MLRLWTGGIAIERSSANYTFSPGGAQLAAAAAGGSGWYTLEISVNRSGHAAFYNGAEDGASRTLLHEVGSNLTGRGPLQFIGGCGGLLVKNIHVQSGPPPTARSCADLLKADPTLSSGQWMVYAAIRCTCKPLFASGSRVRA